MTDLAADRAAGRGLVHGRHCLGAHDLQGPGYAGGFSSRRRRRHCSMVGAATRTRVRARLPLRHRCSARTGAPNVTSVTLFDLQLNSGCCSRNDQFEGHCLRLRLNARRSSLGAWYNCCAGVQREVEHYPHCLLRRRSAPTFAGISAVCTWHVASCGLPSKCAHYNKR